MRINMKQLLATLTLISISFGALAQSEITMTKQEFIDNQINMFSQFDEMQAQRGVQIDEMMKSKMSSEAYDEFKKKNDLAEQEELKSAADCLGVSTQKLESITKNIGSAALVEAANACSSKLPESIAISGMDWTQVPGLAEYNACNEEFIAKKSGVPLAKYKKCAAKQTEN